MSTNKGPVMSKMSEIAMDIEYLLNKGKSFAEVARDLEIPVQFVIEAHASSDLEDQDCDPYATINS
jgi:hypothetical protein